MSTSQTAGSAPEQIHPAGPFPSIRPVKCAPWCTDGDGHPQAKSRKDQDCWGTSHYTELSLEDVAVEFEKDPTHGIYPSIIGPNAYRGHNQLPCVYVHFTIHGHGGDLEDGSCKLTAGEARQLAANLITVADEIEENR